MENSSFGTNSLPPHPAALVAFSQASSLSEALRLSRPFPQGADGKDLSNPFSGSGLSLRPVDAYHGLASPLLHLQNPFFHPSLDPRLPFGAAAFQRPLTASEEHGLKTFHTAFALNPHAVTNLTKPNSGGKIDSLTFNLNRYNPLFNSISMAESSMAAGRLLFQNGQRVQGQPESPSGTALSPTAVSGGSGAVATAAGRSEDTSAPAVGPAVAHPDSRELTTTPSSDAGTERSTPDDIRTSRRRKKSPLDPSCCPVCGITLRSSDLESHFVQEIERLERVSRAQRSTYNSSPSNLTTLSASSVVAAAATSVSSTTTQNSHKREQDSRTETFHRVRINRTNRVRAKARKRRVDERDDLLRCNSPTDGAPGCSGNTPCPICGERLYGTAEELNLHVVQCLRRNGDDIDEDEPLDVEGDSYEEYEWAGQRRVRATSFLQGGFAGVGMHVCKAGDEETEDVVVDGDDTATFGPPQFHEGDVASAVESSSSEEVEVAEAKFIPCNGADSKFLSGSDSKDHVISALKYRIQDLEDANKEAKQKYRCLICLGDYRQPVVSTSCWHVHCEECWLQALGNKKLCPQCNLITSPTHLRRIYM